MSLPRVLWLDDDNTLRMAPPEEMTRLWYNPRTFENLMVAADTERPLKDVYGDTIELTAALSAPVATQFGLKLCCSPDGTEEMVVFYDAIEKKLKIDTTRSSLGEGPKSIEAGSLVLEPNEPLRLPR